MKELLIATKNPGKYREITEVLAGHNFKFVFLGDLDVEDGDFEEDGSTFRENAFKKAKYYGDKLGMFSLGEDSGIEVAALKDELGLETRRWGAGHDASDEEWADFFMRRMEKEEDRNARFMCSACLYGDGIEEYFDGETAGVITEKLMAPLLKGLPLSSSFLPNGEDKVYAALGAERKSEISHRGKCIKKVLVFLKTI
jgi:XTP/dITP diphosphohydrolase